MAIDLSSFKVASGETSSSTKFDNLVQALQDSLNAIGDTSKMAWAAGKIIALNQLAQTGATVGQVLAWNGTDYAPSSISTLVGTELDYKQITSDVTGITATTEGTAVAVITGNSVAYDGAKVRVEFWLEAHAQTAADTVGTYVLLRDSTVLGQVASSVSSSLRFPVHGVFHDTPSAASHTYAVKAFVGAGSLTVKAGAGGAGALLPSFLRVTKA